MSREYYFFTAGIICAFAFILIYRYLYGTDKTPSGEKVIPVVNNSDIYRSELSKIGWTYYSLLRIDERQIRNCFIRDYKDTKILVAFTGEEVEMYKYLRKRFCRTGKYKLNKDTRNLMKRHINSLHNNPGK